MSEGARRPQRGSTWSALRYLVRHRRGAIVGLSLGSFAAGFSESMILALVAHTALAMVDGLERVQTSIGVVDVDLRLATALGIAAALGVLRLVLQVGLAYVPTRVAADTQVELRDDLFEAYSESSWEIQAADRDGHLQELLTNQVNNGAAALLHLSTLVSAVLIFATLVVVAFVLGPVVALLVLALAVLLAIVLRPIGWRARQASERQSQSQLDYAGTLSEAVQLAEETYAFGTAPAARARSHEKAWLARNWYLRSHFAVRLSSGLYQGIVILLLVGGLTVLHLIGTGRIATLGTVVLLLVRASSYGQQAQFAWHAAEQAAPFIERIEAAERRYRANAAHRGDATFPSDTGVELDDVAFAYRPDRPVLTGVTLSVRSGDIVGISGPSGAGKSTLVQLILRMRKPTGGSIRIGRTPIDAISMAEYRRHVAYVPQEPRLYHATVADNIRFFRDLDDEAVQRAARLAHIHDVILGMPDGYDTVVGQRADAVSGGQRQRICLARALAGNPSVLLLDEPTSALDAESEAAIQASLLELRGSLTTFIVAHRPSLLEICDRHLYIGGSAVQVTEPLGAPSRPDARTPPGRGA
jgi:ATP-binding cassette, subfamily B, bacterial